MKSKNFKKVMNVQLIVMIISLIFIITSFFVSALADYREIVLGLVLIMMGYTNLVIYEKKKMAIVYFLCGLIFIIPNVIRLVS